MDEKGLLRFAWFLFFLFFVFGACLFRALQYLWKLRFEDARYETEKSEDERKEKKKVRYRLESELCTKCGEHVIIPPSGFCSGVHYADGTDFCEQRKCAYCGYDEVVMRVIHNSKPEAKDIET